MHQIYFSRSARELHEFIIGIFHCVFYFERFAMCVVIAFFRSCAVFFVLLFASVRYAQIDVYAVRPVSSSTVKKRQKITFADRQKKKKKKEKHNNGVSSYNCFDFRKTFFSRSAQDTISKIYSGIRQFTTPQNTQDNYCDWLVSFWICNAIFRLEWDFSLLII